MKTDGGVELLRGVGVGEGGEGRCYCILEGVGGCPRRVEVEIVGCFGCDRKPSHRSKGIWVSDVVKTYLKTLASRNNTTYTGYCKDIA